MARTLEINVPAKLEPLLYPSRFKAAHGGRGGGKSHFFAEQIAVKAASQPIRVVCIREVQNSIRDSVRQLIVDKIIQHGLDAYLEIFDAEIRGKVGTRAEGSLITFKGMQSYNAANIKSLEGFDIAWVEEAQTLSQASLDMLLPTIRKEQSEIWFSWNPRFRTDPVDVYFRKNKPAGAAVVQINWDDNPWFPTVLKTQMEHDYRVDEDKAEHVWGGGYGATQGAILAKWIVRARKEGRINDDVSYDPFGAPIEISSDIGFRDTATWWFWQRKLGGFSVFKVMHGSGMDAEDWSEELEKTLLETGIGQSMLGRIWLPHDARAKTFQAKYTSVERFVKRFGFDKIRVAPQSKKADQISAARAVTDQCEFNASACEAGLDALEAWEFEWNDETQIFSREPLHNWASHFGDGYAYGCQVMQGLPAPETDHPPPRITVVHTDGMARSTITMDDAWGTASTGSTTRI